MKQFLTLALFLSAMQASAATQFSTRAYELKDFTELEVNGVVKVVYTQGKAYSVKLTGRTDWLDLMELKTSSGKLKVTAKNSKKFNNVKKKDQPDGEHIFILHLTAPCIQEVQLNGVSTFEAKRLTSDQLIVRLNGVSKLLVNEIEALNFHAGINGASRMESKNVQCQKLEATVAGSGKMDMEQITAKKVQLDLGGASKARLAQISKSEDATINVSGASKLELGAETSGLMQIGLAGAGKGELTFKGGRLRTVCKGASKLTANVNCEAINASCDGAGRASFIGTADKVEIERGSVATNIDTSRLNQF